MVVDVYSKAWGKMLLFVMPYSAFSRNKRFSFWKETFVVCLDRGSRKTSQCGHDGGLVAAFMGMVEG